MDYYSTSINAQIHPYILTWNISKTWCEVKKKSKWQSNLYSRNLLFILIIYGGIWREKKISKRIHSKIINENQRKCHCFLNSLNSFKHPTQSKNKATSRSTARPAALTAWASGVSASSQSSQEPFKSSQAVRVQVSSSKVKKLLSGFHNCSSHLGS